MSDGSERGGAGMQVVWIFLGMVVLGWSSCGLAASVSYSYDEQMRLVRAVYDDGTEVGYSYDATGNRVLRERQGGVSVRILEDGEGSDIGGWRVYDKDPAGASIARVYDSDRGSGVVEFRGSGTANGYRLRNADNSNWNAVGFRHIEWSMRYGEWFVVYIAVRTKNGFRYLQYGPAATSTLGTGTYITHGLGSGLLNGTWQRVVRDLEADLKSGQPDNELEAILAFLIRGSGRVDDIRIW